MREIKSVNNELIKEIAKLKDKKYRDKEKKFLVEGYHLIEMAKDFLEIIFVSDKKDYEKIKGVTYYLVSNEVIKKLSQTMNPQGIIGVCTKKEDEKVTSNNVLILDNVQDPGNVGTLIRSALAFNYKDIILSKDSVDIYNDKVIRSSQGALFKVNIIYRNLVDEIKELKNNGYAVYGTSLKNAKPMQQIVFKDKKAIVLGNEGAGVSNDVLNITNENIYLEMNKEIDSLNVGVAGSIIMYELSKN